MEERERVIASRPNLEQVTAIVDFMEEHPEFASGKMRGVVGRNESKKLWIRLSKIVNNISDGPTRTTKSWIKYWADKKSIIRTKVLTNGNNPNILTSCIEKKIWDLFICKNALTRNKYNIPISTSETPSAMREESLLEESYLGEDSMEADEPKPETGVLDVDDRHILIMDKLLKVMTDQATAMTQMAHAAHVNSQAMERLAEASQMQARAIDRLANTFEAISGASHDVRNAILDIDATMERYYTSPT